jgi:hypothetical protein
MQQCPNSKSATRKESLKPACERDGMRLNRKSILPDSACMLQLINQYGRPGLTGAVVQLHAAMV